MDKPKSIKCTMRLLKKGITPEEALKEDHGLEPYVWEGIQDAQAFLGTVFTSPPGWLAFVRTAVPNAPDLINKGSTAIVFVPAEKRTIAVCFGHAQLVLDPDKFERGFGLRVTLNRVARTNLRSVDAAAPDSVTVQRRVQASRDSDIAVFGIDYDRDLLTLAAGTPSSRDFATFLAGKDSLSITCPMEATALQDKCAEVITAYKAKDYHVQYGWIDHIQPVKDKPLLDKLDAKLMDDLEKLRKGQDSDLHLAPPEVVDYMEGSDLHYNGFGSDGVTFQSLDIDDYVLELNRVSFRGGIDEIKDKHRVAVRKEGDNKFAEKWKLYDSFVFETSLKGKVYVLFAGEWFEVQKSFADEIGDFFQNLPRVVIVGPTVKKNEQELIADLEATRRTDLLMLDKTKINPGAVRYANLEPCDFFSRARQFIHLKDGHSSGPISHLWMQGVVSAEAFLSDIEFRKKLREVVRNKNAAFVTYLPNPSVMKVNPSTYTIVYGIMRQRSKSGHLDLPFFSKVSLRTAVQRLTLMGFPVAIELIEKVNVLPGAAMPKTKAKPKTKANRAKAKAAPKSTKKAK